jgi:hypothetical protein
MARSHSLLAFCSPAFTARKIPRGDYFAIHFQLADILKRLTCQVVCLVYGDHLRWIEGEIVEKLIGIGHDVSSENGGAGSDAAKRPRDEQGNLALTSRG